MKHASVLSAIMAMTVISASAQGGSPSNDTLKAVTLYSACAHPSGESADTHEFAEQTCVTYMRGLTDGLFLMQTFVEKKGGVCLPPDQPVSLSDARRIFAAWLPNHPQFATNSAGLVVAAAIADAYKCR
jgi:hypothetical protein